MAGKTLEEFFVSIGVKGQQAVLNTIKNVKKEASGISKIKAHLEIGKTQIAKAIMGMGPGVAKAMAYPAAPEPSAEQKKSDKKEEDNGSKFGRGVDKMVGAVKSFASSAESFDPVSVIKNTTSAIGESLSGINIAGFSLGNLPKGLAEISNSMVSMAQGAVEMAKQSASAQFGLAQRNATAEYYGGAGVKQTGMSRAEHAQLVMEVSGTMGRLTKPMQETLNNLVESKNTQALGRVAAGNWESTGTNRGWMLQQIASQTAGLPPTIAQAIQNSLLKNNADLIQDKGAEKGAQGVNAGWMNLQEDQTKRIFDTTSASFANLRDLSSKFNDMQLSMIKAGTGFANAIDAATKAIQKLPDTINTLKGATSHAPGFVQNLLGSVGLGGK